MARFKQKAKNLYTFSVKGRLNSETARNLNHRVQQLGISLKGKSLILDLYGVERVYPNGTVPLVAIASELRKKKVDTDIIKPRSREMDKLLHRSLFYHLVSPDKFSPPRFIRSRFPIYQFTSYEAQDTVVTEILDICSKELRFAAGMPAAFDWAINELAGNVIDHAQSNLGFAQVVSYPSNQSLSLVIADKGVGIFEALSNAHKTNERDAIKLALQEGITGKPGVNQGFGLHGASRIARAAKGKFVVSSGVRSHSQFAENISERPVGTPYRGTIVELELPINSTIDIGHVIGQEDIYGYFESRFQQDDGTYLIRLNTVSSNFGNRGTGHKIKNLITNALQNCGSGNVTISFENIQIVSSSFADEAFAKLADEMGQEMFMARVRLVNMNRVVNTIVKRAFFKRLGSLTPLADLEQN